MVLPGLLILSPLWGLAEFCLAIITRSRSSAASKDRGSVFLLWAACFLSIGGAVLVAQVFAGWTLPNQRLWHTVALCFFVFGVLFRSYSIFYLGRLFTPVVAIAEDHPLIDSGPYRLIRHPTYTGMLMIVLGLSLSFANAASLLIGFAPVFGCLLWRIHIEEQALSKALGARYRDYMRRTKRLIPFLY